MKTILALTDFTAHAEHAAAYALRLANKLEADLLLYNAFYVYVGSAVPMEGGVFPYYDDVAELEKESLRRLKVLEDKLIKEARQENLHVPYIRLVNQPGTLAMNLERLLKENQIDMIVMGDKSKGGFIDRMFLGSDTENVIKRSSVPVLLVPEREGKPEIKKIGFASDFKHPELTAIRPLVKLARSYNAELICLHVFEKYGSEEEKEGLRFYKKLEQDSDYPNMSYKVLIGEKTGDQLEQYAVRGDIDLLCLVNKEQGFFQRLFKVSTVKEVMNFHNVPILILPAMQF